MVVGATVVVVVVVGGVVVVVVVGGVVVVVVVGGVVVVVVGAAAVVVVVGGVVVVVVGAAAVVVVVGAAAVVVVVGAAAVVVVVGAAAVVVVVGAGPVGGRKIGVIVTAVVVVVVVGFVVVVVPGAPGKVVVVVGAGWWREPASTTANRLSELDVLLLATSMNEIVWFVWLRLGDRMIWVMKRPSAQLRELRLNETRDGWRDSNLRWQDRAFLTLPVTVMMPPSAPSRLGTACTDCTVARGGAAAEAPDIRLPIMLATITAGTASAPYFFHAICCVLSGVCTLSRPRAYGVCLP